MVAGPVAVCHPPHAIHSRSLHGAVVVDVQVLPWSTERNTPAEVSVRRSATSTLLVPSWITSLSPPPIGCWNAAGAGCTNEEPPSVERQNATHSSVLLAPHGTPVGALT